MFFYFSFGFNPHPFPTTNTTPLRLLEGLSGGDHERSTCTDTNGANIYIFYYCFFSARAHFIYMFWVVSCVCAVVYPAGSCNALLLNKKRTAGVCFVSLMLGFI